MHTYILFTRAMFTSFLCAKAATAFSAS